jgi:hypothetical protein
MHDMSSNKLEELTPTEELVTAENLILTTELVGTESLKLIITAKIAAG